MPTAIPPRKLIQPIRNDQPTFHSPKDGRMGLVRAKADAGVEKHKWGYGGVMFGPDSHSQNLVGYGPDDKGRMHVGADVGGASHDGLASDPKWNKEFTALRQAIEAIDVENLPYPGDLNPNKPWVGVMFGEENSDPGMAAYSVSNAPQSVLDAKKAADALAKKLIAQ